MYGVQDKGSCEINQQQTAPTQVNSPSLPPSTDDCVRGSSAWDAADYNETPAFPGDVPLQFCQKGNRVRLGVHCVTCVCGF